MKKTFILILLIAMAASLSAQDYDLDDVKDGFESFAEGTANALPLAASIGLNWNDAYSGKFPHFGVGLTLGAVFLPIEAFEDIYDLTGEASLDDFPTIGLPLPVYTFDGRIGIPVLPLDVGFKFGVLNPSMLDLPDISLGYKMIGGDVRWGIFEDKGLIPELSVGVGYTFLSGHISAPMPKQEIDISTTGAGDVLSLTDSEMLFEWSSNVIDFKAQVSKKLLLLNFSAGAGYSYGISTAGGGLTAGTVNVDDEEITDDDIDLIEDAFKVKIDNEGVLVSAKNNGGAFRLFGGVGLNIFILKIDFGAVYGLPSETLGLSTNVRIQY